jgi:beta-lactamase class A
MTKTTIALALFVFASIARADELTDRIGRIAASIDATVGVSAMDLANGRTLSIRGNERFPMASLYKFPIAEALLKKVTKGEIDLDKEVTIEPRDFAPGHSPLAASAKSKPVTLAIGRLVVLSLGESDNTASDALLKVVGGPVEVMKFLHFIGLNGIDVSRTEEQIGADLKKKGTAAFLADERDTATPDSIRQLFRMAADRADGLGPAVNRFEMDILSHSTVGKNRIAAGVPQGATVMSKTGTSAGGVVNDAALIHSPDGPHRVVIVVFTKGGTATEKAREAVIAKISREIYDDFTRRVF